jgi:hypothetical protein
MQGENGIQDIHGIRCVHCGYDLRGRTVGESCPECGAVIERLRPAWCTAERLHRMANCARLAWIPCVMLLAVPAAFIVGFVTAAVGGNDRVWWVTLILFLVLMPLQLGTQAFAAWRIAACGLGARRARALRVAAMVRVASFALAALCVVVEAIDWRVPSPLAFLAYFTLPLAAIGSDFVTLGALGTLRSESGVLVTGRQAVLPPLARWGLIGVYPLLLVPFLGWFFAPILWACAVAVGFAQVGAVAEACRKQLP